jgi:hypothetical protein
MPPKKQNHPSHGSYMPSPKGDLKFFLNNTSYARSPIGVGSQSQLHLSQLLTSEELPDDPQKAERQSKHNNRKQQSSLKINDDIYANRRDNLNLERPNEKLLRSQLLNINTDKINLRELMMLAGTNSTSASAGTNNRLSFGTATPFFPDIHQKLAVTTSSQHLRNKTELDSLEQISITENNLNSTNKHTPGAAVSVHGDSVSVGHIPQGSIGPHMNFNNLLVTKAHTPVRWNDIDQHSNSIESFAKVGKEILGAVELDSLQRGSSENQSRGGFSKTLNGFSRELKQLNSRESRKDGTLTDSARLGYDVSHLLDQKGNKLRKFEISLSLLERVVTSSR